MPAAIPIAAEPLDHVVLDDVVAHRAFYPVRLPLTHVVVAVAGRAVGCRLSSGCAKQTGSPVPELILSAR